MTVFVNLPSLFFCLFSRFLPYPTHLNPLSLASLLHTADASSPQAQTRNVSTTTHSVRLFRRAPGPVSLDSAAPAFTAFPLALDELPTATRAYYTLKGHLWIGKSRSFYTI